MKALDYFLIIFFIVFNKIEAQTVEPSNGVGKGFLQLEFETLYSHEKYGLQKNTAVTLPKVLKRFGLSDKVELQWQTIIIKERSLENKMLNASNYHFDEMEIGLSINLWKAKGVLPEAALMARIVTSEKDVFTNIGNNISMNFSNIISDKITLNYNIGTLTDLNKETYGFYIANICYEPNSKWHFFIENSNQFKYDQIESNTLSSGFGSQLNDHLTVDFSVGKSLQQNMYFTGMIFVWVVNTDKNKIKHLALNQTN